MILTISQYDSRNLWSPRPGIGTRSPIFHASANEWLSAPKSLEISEREAHIWKIDLTSDSPDVESLLSGEEHVRAARFHFEVDRRRFKIAHGAMRTILSRYLFCSSEELELGQTDYGKPFLNGPHDETLRFNLSHAGEMALLAVTRGREIGIDVEFIRPDFAADEVAVNFFSPFEVAELERVEPSQRTRAFFNCWTRKEAYVKARGEGLSMPLNVFDVTLAPNSVATMLSNRKDDSEIARWIFHDLALNENYVGALVIETTDAPLHISRFQFCK